MDDFLERLFVPLTRIVEPLINLTASSIETPATLQVQLRSEMGRVFESIPLDEIVTRLRDAATRCASPEGTAWIEAEFGGVASGFLRMARRADRRVDAIVDLVAEADAAVPLGSLVALGASATWQMEPLSEPVLALNLARRSHGEVRARHVVQALHETIDRLYYPYLSILWKLTCIRKRAWPTAPRNEGALLKQVLDRLPSPCGLVEPETALFRNAAAHKKWRYLPEGDFLQLWDRDREPVNFPVRLLFRRVLRMYWIAGPALMIVNQWYLVRRVFIDSGIAQAFAQHGADLFGSDPVRAAAASAAIEHDLSATFGAFDRFTKTHDPNFRFGLGEEPPPG